MMRSFIFLLFWALIRQANAHCDSRNWSVFLTRYEANEDHCDADTETEIDAQMEACVKEGSNGKLNRSGHREHGNRRRLAKPESRRLRTKPLQQHGREVVETCDSCNDCAELMICQILAAGGQPYCADSCNAESTTCFCERRLEADHNQGQRNLDPKRGSRAWTELQTTRRCNFQLKAFAECQMQDKDNHCMGDPDLLEVTARCVGVE